MSPLNLVLVSCDPPLHSQVLLGSLQLPVDEVLVMFLAGLNILLFLPLSVLVDPVGSLLVSPGCIGHHLCQLCLLLSVSQSCLLLRSYFGDFFRRLASDVNRGFFTIVSSQV